MSARPPRADRVSEASRRSIAEGSKSFAVAARLFDPVTRDSARLFYAWCRYCDDVVDGQTLGHGTVGQDGTPEERLAALESRTRDAYEAEPDDDPVFAALHRVVHRHGIPLELALAILDGFRMDVENRRYGTVGQLMDYCYRVAGAVGVTMALIMGVEPGDRATLDRACDLGLGFQLTNIARDVMDDARAGRVYLPADLLGVRPDPAFVLDPAHHARVLNATMALLELAERYYGSARIGIAALPWRSAWAIATARGVYREIGRRVRRAEDPWRLRQTVPTWRKLWHVARGAGAPPTYRMVLGDPPRRGL